MSNKKIIIISYFYVYILITKKEFSGDYILHESVKSDIIFLFVILVGILKCYVAEKSKFICQLHYNNIY